MYPTSTTRYLLTHMETNIHGNMAIERERYEEKHPVRYKERHESKRM